MVLLEITWFTSDTTDSLILGDVFARVVDEDFGASVEESTRALPVLASTVSVLVTVTRENALVVGFSTNFTSFSVALTCMWSTLLLLLDLLLPLDRATSDLGSRSNNGSTSSLVSSIMGGETGNRLLDLKPSFWAFFSAALVVGVVELEVSGDFSP